jgi:hypothetical protein
MYPFEAALHSCGWTAIAETVVHVERSLPVRIGALKWLSDVTKDFCLADFFYGLISRTRDLLTVISCVQDAVAASDCGFAARSTSLTLSKAAQRSQIPFMEPSPRTVPWRA